MKGESRLNGFIIGLILVLLLSAMTPFTALADGETPTATETPTEVFSTPDAETTVVTETPPPTEFPAITQTPTPTETTQIEPPLPSEETTPSTEEEPLTELLAEAPEGTELVLVDEQGEIVPLVSNEAEEILLFGDPIWCPATVAVPVPGVGGCTDPAGGANYDPTKLSSLISYLILLDPAVNGVIWIEKSFDSSVQDVVASWTIDGSSFTNMDLFSLTIRGGWNGLGTGTVDTTDRSQLNGRLNITNWQGTITLSDLLITGTSGGAALNVTTTKDINLTRVDVQSNAGNGIFLSNSGGTGKVVVSNSQSNQNGGYGLQISSKGSITLNLVNVLQNLGAGHSAYLDNSVNISASPITISNSHFDNNSGNYGLYAVSWGTISLNSVTASGNLLGTGASLYNAGGSLPKNISIIGSAFNNNKSHGLLVVSEGIITVKDLTANGNGNIGSSGVGVSLNNSAGTGVGVTLSGTNVFNDNYSGGLSITSTGAVLLNNIIANGNDGNGYGAYIDNSTATTAKPVTITGTNQFKYNYYTGLYIYSRGQVSLNNITSNGSVNGMGVYVDNCYWSIDHCTGSGGVFFTGVNNTSDNQYHGVNISSAGAIKINSLTSSWNGDYGAYLDNCRVNAGPCTVNQVITFTGTNILNDNGVSGAYLETQGNVTINNITASRNAATGLTILQDRQGSMGITLLTGASKFEGNASFGLLISSMRSVTLNNITVTGSLGSGGLKIDTCLYSVDHCVGTGNITLAGTNSMTGITGTGIQLTGGGSITLNNITASSNTGYGAYLDNCGYAAGACTLIKSVTLTGTNTFSDNGNTGLYITSGGAIKTNNLTAIHNLYHGAQVSNGQTGSIGSVVMTGYNVFNDNKRVGLSVESLGAISLSNATATGNGWIGGSYGGVMLYNAMADSKPITLSGINNLSANSYLGLQLDSDGIVTIYNLKANDSLIAGGVSLTTTYDGAVYNSVNFLGTSSFSGNAGRGLSINSNGIVKLNNITANNNGNDGAFITNQVGGPGSPRNVILTGTNTFDINGDSGLNIYSYGSVIASNLRASGNGSNGYGNGVSIENYLGTIQRPVILTGVNIINDNHNSGLRILSLGAISASFVTANNNGVSSGNGALLENDYATATGGVTLTGTNTFNDNYNAGLSILTFGAVSVSNVTTKDNQTSYGTYINNSLSPLAVSPGVTISGVNNMSFNGDEGLTVYTQGSITVSSLTASENNGYGAYLLNTFASLGAPVTLAGTATFYSNLSTGLHIESYGAISLLTTTLQSIDNGVAGPGGRGVVLINSGAASPRNVVMAGTNVINQNYSGGLYISSKGKIQLNNIAASYSDTGYGAWIATSVSGSVGDLVMSGTNSFIGNSSYGIQIDAAGTVTLNNINASQNGQVSGWGMMIFNTWAGVPKFVKLTGTNTFDNNRGVGLQVNSLGQITINNLTASNSITGAGVSLTNDLPGAIGGVTLTGYARALANANGGISISSYGDVSMQRVVADGNNNIGVMVVTDGNITLACGSMTGNVGTGLDLNTAGIVTLTGVFAAGNTGGNIDYTGMTGTVNIIRNCPLP